MNNKTAIEASTEAQSPSSLNEALAAVLKPIVKEAVQEAMNGHNEGDSLLTAKALANRLNVPLSWVYDHSNQGNIPTHRLGRYIRFNLHEVLASQKKD